MLKALEVLRRELQNNYEKRPFVIKTELYHKERIEDFHEAIEELEALETKDKLAELEKAILDYYLVKGYGVGIGGCEFKVNISTYSKDKEIQIMFRKDRSFNYETVFRKWEETTKEMFDKAFEYFTIKDKQCNIK